MESGMTVPPEVILTPLPDETGDSQHDCSACHGQGVFACEAGCHTQTCDECEGSGRLYADDSPVADGAQRW
jgi:DnaJ-class molecular chaperone